MFEDEDDFSIKWMESKQYIRMNDKGEPQLVQVDPMTADNGDLIPETVAVFIDGKGPVVMSREAAEMMIETSDCQPIELVTQWKHRKVN